VSRAPVATTVLGGFLGAGKTTLVNRLLRAPEGRRIAVLVNDFGEVAIDSLLIEANDGPVLNLANGCVCCSMGGDLSHALDLILEPGRWPDHLVIEASGVAEPDRIADIARADPDLRLDAVVTLVDAEQVGAQFADPRLRELVRRQIAGADFLLLNKSDLAADLPAVTAWLRGLAPQTAILPTRHAEAPVELILGDLERAPRGRFRADAPPADTAGHETMFARWSAGADRRLSRAAIEGLLARLTPAVLRLKGWVTLDDGAVMAVQAVGGRRELRPLPTPPDGGPMTRLTAIGLAGDLDAQALDALFAAA
jgi:G3E family GTPase